MKRAIRNSLLRAARDARARRHGRAYPVTVTLDVPAAVTAGAPVWDPSRPTAPGQARRAATAAVGPQAASPGR